MENTPSGHKKAPKSRVILTDAQRKEWRDYWEAMPPSPVYPQICCLCGASMTDRKYLCPQCDADPESPT